VRPSTASAGVVALAASAGGLTALSHVISPLPADFGAAVLIVQHVDPRHPSLLAQILGRRTVLPVHEATDGEQLRPGTVYIAPPDNHLVVNPEGTVSLTHSELVHFVRPSADLLFESAATSYASMTIAVVLSGTGRDGSSGVQAVKRMGGTVIAQDRATSEFYGMPAAAIDTGDVDYVLPVDQIAETLVLLVQQVPER
jgi:two-component system chemotaxis response regulator CheB